MLPCDPVVWPALWTGFCFGMALGILLTTGLALWLLRRPSVA